MRESDSSPSSSGKAWDHRPQIGVLAIQGDYEAHARALEVCGAIPSLVKTADALRDLDGLILPGGESTTMLKFLGRNGFFDALKQFAEAKPVFGTCAGAILLAKDVRNPIHPEQTQQSLGVLDMSIERNSYGSQKDSAILALDTKLAGGPMETVFIRAPRIVATGPEVEVLAERDGFPVLVRQGCALAATFHPEMSVDRRVHQFFVDSVRNRYDPAAR